MAEVVIDLNARTHHNLTFSLLEDVTGAVSVGQQVTVVEPESDIVGAAVVTSIDGAKGMIYLRVDWGSLHARTADEPDDSEALVESVISIPTSGFVETVHFGQSVHLAGGAYLTKPTGFSLLESGQSVPGRTLFELSA